APVALDWWAVGLRSWGPRPRLLAGLAALASSMGLPRMLAGRRGPLDAARRLPRRSVGSRLRRFRRRLGRRGAAYERAPPASSVNGADRGFVSVVGHAARTPRSSHRANARRAEQRAHTA